MMVFYILFGQDLLDFLDCFFVFEISACPPPARNASQREAGGSRAAQVRRTGKKF